MSQKLSDYQFELPEELIAHYPPTIRGESRMLVIDRSKDDFHIVPFSQLPSFLNEGDLIVMNNTRVIPARLYGRKETGGRVEFLLTEEIEPGIWRSMLKPARRMKDNTPIQLDDLNDEPSPYSITILGRDEQEESLFRLAIPSEQKDKIFATCGHMPLPPYIQRKDENKDRERYQTVFSSQEGAVAAPTAGLHFTDEILAHCQAKGVKTTELTLHTGIGTFLPVSSDDISNHHMHSEMYELNTPSAKLINDTRAAGKRVIAIGTTSIRTLESCVDEAGLVHAQSGSTEIFLYPPYQIKGADALVTNFHLPGSTLLMLVSCLSSREKILQAYDYAIAQKMRFFSYGDCCLII